MSTKNECQLKSNGKPKSNVNPKVMSTKSNVNQKVISTKKKCQPKSDVNQKVMSTKT